MDVVGTMKATGASATVVEVSALVSVDSTRRVGGGLESAGVETLRLGRQSARARTPAEPQCRKDRPGRSPGARLLRRVRRRRGLRCTAPSTCPAGPRTRKAKAYRCSSASARRESAPRPPTRTHRLRGRKPRCAGHFLDLPHARPPGSQWPTRLPPAPDQPPKQTACRPRTPVHKTRARPFRPRRAASTAACQRQAAYLA